MLIDVELTPKQQEFREEVVAFTEKHCSPEYVTQCDENGEPPLDIFTKIAEKGWLGVGLSPEHGGFGHATEVVILLEQLEYSFIQLGSLVSRGAMYPAGIIADFGTPEQKKEWLPRALRGEARAVIGISEPATGSDMSSLSTRAELDGDEWRINGEKLYMSGLDYSQIIFLAAITDPDAAKRKGVSVFMIDADTPGIEATRLKTLGAWQNRTYHAHLRDVRVPKDRLMGKLNEGWTVLNGHMERERAGLAGRAVGAAQAVLDEAVAYAKTRNQFGQPIGKFQAISHKLASMQIDIHVARVATYDLARRIDAGHDCKTEAAVVKTFASEMYKRAADEGLQVCGGSGYLRDSAMQRHYRDARLLTIGGGTSEIQRNIISRALGL